MKLFSVSGWRLPRWVTRLFSIKPKDPPVLAFTQSQRATEVIVVHMSGGSSPLLKFGPGWRQNFVGVFGRVLVYTDPSCVWFSDENGQWVETPIPCKEIFFVPSGKHSVRGYDDVSPLPYAYCHPDIFEWVDKAWLSLELLRVLNEGERE